MVKSCSVIRNLKIVKGDMRDYRCLSHFHYRDGRLGAFCAIYAMKNHNQTVGVIVYSMPVWGCQLRNVALGGMFSGLDATTRMSLVNKNIRCISRVIIEPRYRGLSLASRLVAETIPQLNVPIVEAMAVMGQVNPFFEKAGMKAYKAAEPARCVQLREALSMVGIEQAVLIDAEKVQTKINQLCEQQQGFLEKQIRRFLQTYGKRRSLPTGIERTRFVLSKLSSRPVYYIWIKNTD